MAEKNQLLDKVTFGIEAPKVQPNEAFLTHWGDEQWQNTGFEISIKSYLNKFLYIYIY